MEAPSITLENVWVEFPVYGMPNRSLKKALLRLSSGGRIANDAADVSRVVALRDINLQVKDGDRLGLIGGNGAGKTTLLRVMAGAMRPARGRMRRVGNTSSLFDVALGMNHEATGWDNIVLRGLFLGLSPAEVRARTDDIVDFSGLTAEQLSRPIRTYSSGMMLRLAFAVSTCIYPDVLLLDEWISVGDSNFVEKAQRRMHEMVNNAAILVIASHVEFFLQVLCNKAIYLRGGELIAQGTVDEILALYHQAT